MAARARRIEVTDWNRLAAAIEAVRKDWPEQSDQFPLQTVRNACRRLAADDAAQEQGRALPEDDLLNLYDDSYDTVVDQMGHNDRHYHALRAVERRVKAELMGGTDGTR
jgi:hypothetical protein